MVVLENLKEYINNSEVVIIVKTLTKLVLIILNIIPIFITPIYATTNTVDEVIKSEYLESSSEKNELNNVFNANLGSLSETVIDLNKVNDSNNINIKNIKNKDMFKIYTFTDDIVLTYENNKRVEKLISNKYMWLCPLTDENGNFVTCAIFEKISLKDTLAMRPNIADDKDSMKYLKDNDGKWVVTRVGNDFPVSYMSLITDKNKLIELLKENNIKSPSQVKLVLPDRYMTYILYIRQGNDEYGIPFTMREDLTGLQNEKLYKMDDLVNILKEHFPPDYSSNGLTGGGGSVVTQINPQITVVSIIIISFIVIFTLGIVFVKRHKKS